MNILFHIDVECVPENGGIERVTSLLTKELRKRGHKVYSSYTVPVEREAPRPDFDGAFILSSKKPSSLTEEIIRHEIDVIVVQKTFRDLPWIKQAVKESGRGVKILYCLHTRPVKKKGIDGFRSLVFNDKSRSNLIKIPMKILLYPMRKRQYDHQQYVWPAIYADKTLVLSEQYIEPWLEISGGVGRGMVEAMPNPLSFNPHTNEGDIKSKKKKVLIVARMEERQKNLKEALRIWSWIEKDQRLGDWTLEIVGNGPDRKIAEKEARSLNLKRAKFHGYQNPQSFYKEASVFIMTSRFEGWPMTINESLQYGCVPVVYDSFSAIHDVIKDGKNGFLVKSFDTDQYVNTLSNLMLDRKMREKMALDAVDSSGRFQIGPIINRWEKLLEDLTKDN